jgi:Predicted pPIWI-associating nuclease
MTSPGGYDELGRLARQMAEISSVYTGFLVQFQKQLVTTDALKFAVSRSAVLDRGVLRSALTILRQTNQSPALTPRMNSLLNANRALSSIVQQIALPKSTLSAAYASQTGIHEVLQRVGLSKALTASLMQMDRSRMLSASLVAQQKLAILDGVRLGNLLGADATFRRSNAAHLGILTRSYRELIAAAETQPSLVARLPLLTAYPPVEYFRHIQALESVSAAPTLDAEGVAASVDASLEEAVPSIDDLLRRFNPSLCPLLDGARKSLVSRNPDRIRHVTTSLRELFTQVLHSLASDREVGSWTSQPDHFHNGRPTRRARLLYVCRNINEGPFIDFVRDDVNATLSFVDSLSSGTHTVEFRLSPAQLKSTVARMESLLVFLLQIRNDG